VLANLTWQDIANKLSDSNSNVTKGIVGSANYLTAAICQVTNQQPTSVCNSDPIPQIENALGKTVYKMGGMQISILAFHEAVLRQPE